jgi:hypothetical protein
VGWAIVVGHTKRQFQTTNLLEVNSKPEFFKNKHFTSCNVSKCPYGTRDIEKETNFYKKFNVFGIFVYFPHKNWNFYVFPVSYTCKHVISYKCKYELFHLNMARLFQEINKGANMLMQKVCT